MFPREFLEGWTVTDSAGKVVPVRFTYVPREFETAEGAIRNGPEIFGFYFDDSVKHEQGRIFIRE